MIARTIAALCAVVAAGGHAQAGRRVGIVVANESRYGTPIAAEVARWCSQQGFEIDNAALAPYAVAAMADCFVLEDEACASRVVTLRATTAEVIYVSAQAVGDDTSIDVHWYAGGAEPQHDGRTCATCDDTRLRSSVDKILSSLAARVHAPPSMPPPARVAPPPITTASIVPAAVAVVAVPAERGEAAEVRPWHLGLWLGAELPRGSLDPGLLLGGGAAYALDRETRWLVHAAVDWVRTGHNATTLLSPTWFPRSAGDLEDRADLVTLAAGGSVRVARFGGMSLRAGVEAGAQYSRARLSAYGMARVQTGIAPVATAEVAIVWPAGPIAWRGLIAWREARRELGAASAYAEPTTSGGLVAIGLDW